MVDKKKIKIFLLGSVCIFSIVALITFSRKDFFVAAAAVKFNTQVCSSNTECASGFCSPYGNMCCNPGQCGYGDGAANPRQCLDSGQERDTVWNNGHQEGACDNGIWKTRPGGAGCPGWMCADGTTCSNNICSGTLAAPKKSANTQYCGFNNDCVSGFCSLYGNMCCNPGQCGWGDGALFFRQCVADGGYAGNQLGNFVCRNAAWKTQIGKSGCNTWPCDGSNATCQNNICVAACVPKTCVALGNYKCGSWPDGCAGTVDCGTCSNGHTCGSSGICISGCVSSYSKKCYDGDIYWYDSCNNRGEIYDSCASNEACSNGECVAKSSNCVANSSKKCDGGNVYWYDLCGVRGDLYQNCGNNTLTASYRCNGNWLQQNVITKDCVNGACTQTPAWNNVQDCAVSGKICKNGVCVSGDAAAPIISGLAPAGTVGNPTAVLTATTNEAADCRYNFWYDKSYDQMTSSFKTSDKLYHSDSVSLPNRGSYIYYVRCKDAAGNANLTSARISFNYPAPAAIVSAVQTTSKETAPADKAAPVISRLAPFGTIDTATTTISCVTDEKAICKYDIADTDYDSMENKMDANGDSQSKIINLQNTGSYFYYVRCKDVSDNKNDQSARVDFTYAPPLIPGPAISDPLPGGAVYQKSVLLTASTDKISECRWSNTDQDFDAMTGLFSTTDGQSQQAAVDLNDYGQYAYYVRCKDQSGNKTATSTVIGFEYKNPEVNPASEVVTPVDQEPVACENPATGSSDGTCDTATDCVCDPDCLAGGDQADPDCAGMAGNGAGSGSNLWIIIVPVALIILIVVALVVVIRKRREGDGADDEIP